MAAPAPGYPFAPKSNAHLRAGQFWAVPLSDGRFACGRVLDVQKSGDVPVPANSRMFLAGLLNWAGSQPPTDESIADARLIEQGFAHIKTILTTGGEVLGRRDLDADGIVPAAWRSHEAGGTVWVYEGARRLRPATAADRGLPIMSTWGYSVISVLAEAAFVDTAQER